MTHGKGDCSIRFEDIAGALCLLIGYPVDKEKKYN
jgi:hypothetical protein